MKVLIVWGHFVDLKPNTVAEETEKRILLRQGIEPLFVGRSADRLAILMSALSWIQICFVWKEWHCN